MNTGLSGGDETKAGRSSDIPRTRSPSFPSLSLRKAVEKLEPLHKAAKKFPVSLEVALKHLGYNSTISSNSGRAIGALEAYGLIETVGSGKDRKVAVSDMGAQILLGHPDRPTLLKKAALLPASFAEVWALQSENELPPDDAIRHHLLWELKFNDTAVPTFIASFRDTLAYAGLSTGDKLEDGPKAASVKVAAPRPGLWDDFEAPAPRAFKVGDYVQWRSGGVDQFDVARPIKGFHGDAHAYFDNDGKSIAPVSELMLMDPRASPAPPLQPITAQPPVAGGEHILIVEERFTLDEGPVTIRWPSKLSAESVGDFEHHLNGLLARARRKAGVQPKPPGS